MYVVEAGDAPVHCAPTTPKTSRTSARATSSASARCSSASRARRRSRRSTDAVLLRLPPDLFAAARRRDTPSSARGSSSASQQYDFRRRRPRPARLRRGDPAGGGLGRRAGLARAGRAGRVVRGRRRRRASRPVSRRHAGRSGSGASRTSTSSTRWTAAPRASRWSAATSAAPSASRTSASSCTRRPTARASPGSRAGAEELGLAARSVRASKSRLDELPLPAIVHWEGNHWVVLYDVDDEHVRVADPARGLRRITRDEFVENWSGYASLLAYDERLAEAPEAQHEPRAGSCRSSGRTAGTLALAVVLAADRGRPRARAADPHAGRRRPRARRTTT